MTQHEATNLGGFQIEPDRPTAHERMSEIVRIGHVLVEKLRSGPAASAPAEESPVSLPEQIEVEYYFRSIEPL